MAYNTIKKKKCKEPNCPKYPVLGLNGFCYDHVPPEILAKKQSRTKEVKKARNKRNTLSRKLHAEQDKIDPERIALEKFYLLCRTRMLGICQEGVCLNHTNPNDSKYYRWSVCHVVPKSLVPRVAANEYNWLELCQDHHNEFDSTFEKASKMKCFAEAKRKFNLFKHLIPADELRKVNPYLL